MRIKSLSLLIILILGIVSRAPLYHTPWWRTNDAYEYVDIARNLANGEGLIQKIKFRLYDANPVVTSALRTRPPLTSLIYALVIKLNSDVYTLQILNLACGLINAYLVFFLALNFVDPPLALIGGVLAVLNPNILITSRLILSDQLFAFFPLVAANIFYSLKKETLKVALLGLCCGLLALTRLEGLALLALFAIHFRKKIQSLAILLAVFLIVALPYFWLNWQTNGSPIFTTNSIHYSLFDIRQATEGGFEKTFPSPLFFITHNFSWVFAHVAQTTFLNFASLFEFGYFGPSIILLALALWRFRKKYILWWLFSLAIMLQYSSLWSATFERSRHFIFVFLLLLPPILEYVQSQRRNWFVWFLVVGTVVSYLGLDVHRIVWARTVDREVSVWDRPDKTEMFSWIRENTGADAVTASTNPFMVNLRTDRPSVALPANLTSENLFRFIKKYGVSYVLIINEDKLDTLFEKFPRSADFSDGHLYFVKT